MTYEIKIYPKIGSMECAEKAVCIVTDEDDNDNVQVVTIHPWGRPGFDGSRDRSVFVSVGWETPENEDLFDEESGELFLQNSISNREEFVTALLEVFPELQRADGGKE